MLGFRVYWYHIRLFVGFQSILLVLQQKTMCWGSEWCYSIRLIGAQCTCEQCTCEQCTCAVSVLRVEGW